LLQRTAAYVADFHHQLAGIVLEEHYVQDVRLTVDPKFFGAALPRAAHRVLTSDLVLLRPLGADRYMEYRDVFEVDGKPVRDRGERLINLFIAPPTQTAEQAGRILQSGALLVYALR
jgi:hypothetical protein